MSLSASDIAYYQSLFNSRYAALVPMVFVMYDWVVTFDREVDLIWTKLGRNSILFLVNRYVHIFLIFFQLGTSFGPQIASICNVTGYIIYALTVILWVVIAVFSAVRVWALTAKHRVLSGLVLCVGLIPAVANFYWFIKSPFMGIFPAPLPFGGCYWASNVSPIVGKITGPTARAASILCDSIVLTITWTKMYNLYVLTRKLKTHRSNFRTTNTMLFSGTGYFGAMLIFGTIQLVFSDILHGFTLGFLIGQMNRSISNVLISRFILDLKQATFSPSSIAMGSMSGIRFALPQETPADGIERTSSLEEGQGTTSTDPGDNSPVTSISDSTGIIQPLSVEQVPRLHLDDV